MSSNLPNILDHKDLVHIYGVLDKEYDDWIIPLEERECDNCGWCYKTKDKTGKKIKYCQYKYSTSLDDNVNKEDFKVEDPYYCEDWEQSENIDYEYWEKSRK